MAKKYIVLTTVQGREKGGKKFVIHRGVEPQDIPAGLVKELLARGTIEEVKAGATVANSAAAVESGAADVGAVDDGGTGDDVTGD